MTFLNEYDIEDAVAAFRPEDYPNLAALVQVVDRLRAWTNANSDGWCYWPKPSRAATKAQDAIQTALTARYRGEVSDLTHAGRDALIRPIKAFLTRQGVTGQAQDRITRTA